MTYQELKASLDLKPTRLDIDNGMTDDFGSIVTTNIENKYLPGHERDWRKGRASANTEDLSHLNGQHYKRAQKIGRAGGFKRTVSGSASKPVSGTQAGSSPTHRPTGSPTHAPS